MIAGRKVRWGILSTGRIADWFCNDFPFVDGGELVAVASRSRERAEAFAREHEIPRSYGSYEELLHDSQVDVVYVATPHVCHFANARDALEAGKAVLCEKPLTVNPRECRGLIETAERTGAYLMEAMWTWFLPAVRKALEWVEAGRIGRLHHVQADFGYPQLPYDPKRREYDAELGGGALLEMGIYPVAFAQLFLRQNPDSIRVTARRAPNGVEDDVVAVFDYSGGEIATLGTSFRCKLRNWAYVIGDQGYIAIPDFWRANECFLYQLDECVGHFAECRDSQGFCHEADAVNEDLVLGRRQSEVVPLSDSLAFQEHMARIRTEF